MQLSENIYNQKSTFDLGFNFNLQFPNDLFSPRHGGNFMIIFINEQKDIVGNDVSGVRIRRPVLDENGNRKLIERSRKVTANTSTNVNKRLSEKTVTTGAIALYIPGQLTVSYNMAYQGVDIGFVVGTALNKDITNLARGTAASLTTKEGIMSTINSISKAAGGQASNIAGEFGEPLVQGTYAVQGVAENPFKQLLFSGLDFRKFNFTFTMYPRTQKEAVAINNIIELLRYHMHPEEKTFTGGRYFIVPSDFDIEFYRIVENQDEKSNTTKEATVFENEFLYAISTCVLSDMVVNYTPAAEGFVSHKDGSPLGVTIQLSFIETEILTKKRLLELNRQKYLKNEIPNAKIGG